MEFTGRAFLERSKDCFDVSTHACIAYDQVKQSLSATKVLLVVASSSLLASSRANALYILYVRSGQFWAPKMVTKIMSQSQRSQLLASRVISYPNIFKTIENKNSRGRSSCCNYGNFSYNCATYHFRRVKARCGYGRSHQPFSFPWYSLLNYCTCIRWMDESSFHRRTHSHSRHSLPNLFSELSRPSLQGAGASQMLRQQDKFCDDTSWLAHRPIRHYLDSWFHLIL